MPPDTVSGSVTDYAWLFTPPFGPGVQHGKDTVSPRPAELACKQPSLARREEIGPILDFRLAHAAKRTPLDLIIKRFQEPLISPTIRTLATDTSEGMVDGEFLWEAVFVLDAVEIEGNQVYLTSMSAGRLLEVWIIDNATPGRKGDYSAWSREPYGYVEPAIEEGNLVMH